MCKVNRIYSQERCWSSFYPSGIDWLDHKNVCCHAKRALFVLLQHVIDRAYWPFRPEKFIKVVKSVNFAIMLNFCYWLKANYADQLLSFDAFMISANYICITSFKVLILTGGPYLTWHIQNKCGRVFPDLIGSRADILSIIAPGHCRDGELTLIGVEFDTGVVRARRAEGRDAEALSFCSLMQHKYTHERRTKRLKIWINAYRLRSKP